MGGYPDDDAAGFFDWAAAAVLLLLLLLLLAAVLADPKVDGAALLIGGYPANLAGAGAAEGAAAFAAPSPCTPGGIALIGG